MNNNIIIRIDDVLKKEFQNIISENGMLFLNNHYIVQIQ